MNKIKVGILGAAGYTGGELLRLLLNHSEVEIEFAHSKSQSGLLVSEVHTDLIGDTNLTFTNEINSNVNVMFLCLGHGESKELISEFNSKIKIIDLSQDFRTQSPEGRSFIYGLPELNKENIKMAKNIANPGCFATAIQLALLPLAEKNLIKGKIQINCTTGSTGAGQALSETSHFSKRQNNLSVYKPFVHQHLEEINKSLKQLQPDFSNEINMFPQRGAFTRGILACVNLTINESSENIKELYRAFYETQPFVHISNKNIELKQVINTNKCLLYLEKFNDQLMIISVIDNLLKGASGQAVQNMNIMFGLDETLGLKLKASAF